MTASIARIPNPDDGQANLLKGYLDASLPPNFALGDGEMIDGVVVLVRIVEMEAEGELPERYEYVTSVGMPFALARGMLQCIHEQLINLYQQVLDAADAEDEDGN